MLQMRKGEQHFYLRVKLCEVSSLASTFWTLCQNARGSWLLMLSSQCTKSWQWRFENSICSLLVNVPDQDLVDLIMERCDGR